MTNFSEKELAAHSAPERAQAQRLVHKKVYVIGGATLDTIISYEDMETLVHQRRDSQQSYLLLEEGKKIEVREQAVFSGGGATNTAVSFKRQGYEVGLACKIGKDAAGTMVLDELKGYGLDVSDIRYAEVGTSSSFVVPSLKGDRTVFAYRGANTTLQFEDLPLAKIVKSDFLYITSLSKASAEHLPDIVAAAREAKVSVAVNPGISQLKLGGSFLKTALSGIDTLILNYEEAQQFMSSLMHSDGEQALTKAEKAVQAEGGSKLFDTAINFGDVKFSLRQFFRKVLSLGPRIVVVTNGGEGVYVATPEQLYFHRALSVKVVNTLGAGDAFGSSFVGAMQRGVSIADAIRAGLVNSASVIREVGAKSGLLSLEQIEVECAKINKEGLRILDWEVIA